VMNDLTTLVRAFNADGSSSGVVVSRHGDQVQVATLRGMVSASAAEQIAVGDRVVIASGVARPAQSPTLICEV
ncbi:MAG: hypothetical protein HQM06_18045, partial [Magnetococcales bacterium]|nr:hypothetical protein [Magnetococcales bacterium]